MKIEEFRRAARSGFVGVFADEFLGVTSGVPSIVFPQTTFEIQGSKKTITSVGLFDPDSSGSLYFKSDSLDIGLLSSESITFTSNPLLTDGTPVSNEVRWALLKSYQARYGGVFMDPPPPPRAWTQEEIARYKKLHEDAEDAEVQRILAPMRTLQILEDGGEEDPIEPCMNCALPGYESPFEPDREDCQACHGTGRCPESVNENPPKQYKTAKRKPSEI